MPHLAKPILLTNIFSFFSFPFYFHQNANFFYHISYHRPYRNPKDSFNFCVCLARAIFWLFGAIANSLKNVYQVIHLFKMLFLFPSVHITTFFVIWNICKLNFYLSLGPYQGISICHEVGYCNSNYELHL